MAPSSKGLVLRRGAAAITLAGLIPVLIASGSLMAAEPQGPAPQTRLISNVNVVDVEKGTVLAGYDVLIAGDKIAQVVPHGGLKTTETPPIVEGRGLYLIPGLVESHAHYVDADTYGPLMIANGVTFVRDMGGPTEQNTKLRDRLNRGEVLGPEMVTTGALLDGDPPFWPFSIVCKTPEEGRAAVRTQVAAGVNEIKVYSRLKKDVYIAIVDEAHKHGLRAVGHVPIGVTLDEAMAAGQDEAEHLIGFGAVIGRLAGKPTAQPPTASEMSEAGWGLYPDVDKARLREYLAKVRASGMVQVPTLAVMKGMSRLTDPKAQQDPALQYVPVPLRGIWDSDNFKSGAAGAGTVLPYMQDLVGELHRAGVTLLCGTDLGGPYVVAGFSLHDEMAMFQDAGVPAADVLRSTTIVPLRTFGLSKRLGTVAEGKVASLVLLRVNPLEDIRNARQVEAVFLRGQYFDRARLDAMLADVRGAVKRSLPVEETVELSLPGEVVARGRYAARFQTWDAGVEDFLITKDRDGYHLMAHNEPKGGFMTPFVVTVHVGPDFRFRSAEWRQLSTAQLKATYTAEAGRIKAEATQAGQPLPAQELPLPENAAVGAPAYANDFLLIGLARLEVGETKEFQSLSFGYPSWQLSSGPLVLTREPDARLARPEGEVTARVYKSRIQTPAGEFNTTLWTDEGGVVLKSTLRMPFGTVEAVRE